MSAPSSALVVRLSALGDVVLASAVASALRDAWPAARIEFLAAEPHGRILSGLAGLDALHLWSGEGPVPAAVRGRTFDVVVDLSGTSRSRRLLRGVKGRRLLRIRKQTLRRLAFVRLRPLGADGRGLRSALDRMFATVAPLGIARGGRRPRLGGAPPPPDGPVLIAPGAGRDTKRWPAPRFQQIALRLAREGERVVVAGAAEEGMLLEEVAAGTPAEVVAVEDPAGLPAVVARSPICITNDSGLLHVAEACGATVVAIFGPTHPRLGFAPLDPASVAVHAGTSCSPCDLHGPVRCPKRHFRCMLEIPAERVLAQVRALRPAPPLAAVTGRRP